MHQWPQGAPVHSPHPHESEKRDPPTHCRNGMGLSDPRSAPRWQFPLAKRHVRGALIPLGTGAAAMFTQNKRPSGATAYLPNGATVSSGVVHTALTVIGKGVW